MSANDAVYVYERHHEGRHLVVALNLTGADQPLDLTGEVLITTHLDNPTVSGLRANEGRIIRSA